MVTCVVWRWGCAAARTSTCANMRAGRGCRLSGGRHRTAKYWNNIRDDTVVYRTTDRTTGMTVLQSLGVLARLLSPCDHHPPPPPPHPAVALFVALRPLRASSSGR
eukprot:5082294-Prymnesium_polylepis.1